MPRLRLRRQHGGLWYSISASLLVATRGTVYLYQRRRNPRRFFTVTLAPGRRPELTPISTQDATELLKTFTKESVP